MSVVAALFSGISGISSNGAALAVAGDNIANMSTPAFKSSVAVFESALTQRLGNAEIGLGGRLAGTTANFTQGGFANTTRPTDLAIQGSGFFIVESEGGERFYTRAGIFEKNGTGELVTSAGGLLLQGYAVDSDGGVSGTLSTINLSNIAFEPSATTSVSMSLNLDSSTAIRGDAFNGTSFPNAETTSDFSVTTNAFDSLGNSRTIITYFRKSAANTWTYHALTDGSNLSTSVSGSVIVGEGTMSFNSDGQLTGVVSSVLSTGDNDGTREAGENVFDATDGGAAGTIPWAGGASAASPITFDFGQVSGSAASTTQYSASSAVRIISQDGGAQGDLQTISVDTDGTIFGTFSNGSSREVYRIPLATFANEEGLRRAGVNLYSENTSSGLPQIGAALTSGRGEVRSFSVEQSNTDLAAEFVKIITFQRAFQASSRTVSTAAELLQDLVNIGR